MNLQLIIAGLLVILTFSIIPINAGVTTALTITNNNTAIQNSAALYDFGESLVADIKNHEFVIENQGSIATTIGNFSNQNLGLSSPFSIATPNSGRSKIKNCRAGIVLVAKARCSFIVRFAPTIAGNYTTRIKIAYTYKNSNGSSAASKTFSYTITGRSIYPPCTNGAANPPVCNSCESGLVLYNNLCQPTCTNGTLNPPLCNSCPQGKIFYNGKCETPCNNSALNPPVCNTCAPNSILTDNTCNAFSNIPNLPNLKKAVKYDGKIVFLIPDNDANSNFTWQNALITLPTAIWTNSGNNIEKHPILIYHREGNHFDADGIVNFINEYKATKIISTSEIPQSLKTLLQTDAAINPANVVVATPQELFFYWSSFNTVVYVDNNYENALLASTYASLINAPLIIKGINDTFNLSGRKVICVPSAFSASCTESISLEGLRIKYISLTSSDKILITNASLTKQSLIDQKSTLPSGNFFTNMYYYSSLAAPILASAKHELLLTVQTKNKDSVNTTLKTLTNSMNPAPAYLTIVGSPLEIEQTVFINGAGYRSIDSAMYGDLDNDQYGFAEMKTGRIYGFSLSDISSYMMRVLFYSELPQSDEIMISEQALPGHGYFGIILGELYTAKGHSVTVRTENNKTTPADFMNKKLIYYNEHGAPTGSGFLYSAVPKINNTVIITESCATCAFDMLVPTIYDSLFCLELFRKGATAVIASVDSTGFHFETSYINHTMYQDLGTVIKDQANLMNAYNLWMINVKGITNTYHKGSIEFLLGDPTFSISFEHNPILPETITSQISENGNIKTAKLTWPTLTHTFQGKQYLFWENLSDASPLGSSFSNRAFTKIGPFQNMFPAFTLETQLDPVFKEKIEIMSVHKDTDGYYIYFAGYFNLSTNPLEIVTDNIFDFTIRNK